MSDQIYKEYLAARLLAESRPVTYRLLSRAVKVHVNQSKQMLYEFHKNQNAKKPRSIHATYLVTGKKRTSEHTNGGNGRDGEDAVMQDSPFPSSLPETQEPSEKPPEKAISLTSIMLVREEELEKTKADFSEITSIHIYSLEPGPIEDLGVLSLCNEEVVTKFTSDDALERWKLYGCIHNPYIKRRTPKSSIAASKAAPKAAAKPTTKPQLKENTPTASANSKSSSTKTTTSTAPKATLHRSDSTKSNPSKKGPSVGDIFKSFAKTKPPKTKESTATATEDSPMAGMSEDSGSDSEPGRDAPKVDEAKLAAARKEKEARREELLKMMEDDVVMTDAATPQDTTNAADEASQDTNGDAPASSDSQNKSTQAEPEAAAVMTVEGGRRRGRRRVTKRKKVKDEDGYLVTKEETVWESFSEEEKPPESKKLKPVPSSSAAKGGKKGAAKGQGSIASFFKKA